MAKEEVVVALSLILHKKSVYRQQVGN